MKSVQMNGILPQVKFNKIHDPLVNNDNIIIDIGRDGRFLFSDGKHRFTIARIIGLKKLPVKVGKKHKELIDFPDRCLQSDVRRQFPSE